MKSRTRLIAASLLVLSGAASALPAGAQAGASYEPPAGEGGPPPSDGPQGSSQVRPGEERFDRTGHAGTAAEGAGVFALSNLLPAGSHAEVTSLDTGKTILVVVRGGGAGLIELSSAAARQLGVAGNAAVRVRRVTASAQDAALLAAGGEAPPRADAPPVLLAGLRRQLGGAADAPKSQAVAKPVPGVAQPRATPTPARPAPKPAATAAGSVPAAKGLFVQIAALSNLERAHALAGRVGGVVRSAGKLHRVQIGPYPNAAAAQRSRADMARSGYGDARIVSLPDRNASNFEFEGP